MNNRKLRKLFKDPVGFARDAVGNRANAVTRWLPRTNAPVRRYTVIAAVYGVEKYLDEFFRSMERQTLGFERHVQLIMVDDGSPDRSAEIIAAWQSKYPRAIHYIRKENGGQASARNVGLEHATGDWVTFVDPDDFVDTRYFERVSQFLDRHDGSDVALVSCNFILFQEKTRQLADTHPLRFRFTAGDRIVRTSDLGRDIQLTVNSALFRRDLLESTGLRFDEAIRPSFEDAHFVNRYLLAVGERTVGFAPHARYYYRKREDESSSLDRAWTNPGLYDAVLDRGCADLFRRARERSPAGEIPVWLQRVVLYHLIWYFKRLVDGSEKIAFLTPEQRDRFRELVRELVSKIDDSTILDFELGGAWLYHKVGLLGLFKNTKPEFQHVYVQDYDATKGLVQLRYFYRGEPELEVFTIDGAEVFPAFAKVRRHDFLGDVFVDERIVWLPVGDLSGRLEVAIGGAAARIMLRGKSHRDPMPLKSVSRLQRRTDAEALRLSTRLEHAIATGALSRKVYRDAFLFMDRDTQGDDNAEHLYRHVRASRPDINAFFVLRRASHDWDRLERDGFRLLAFGSLQHRAALLNARHLISSHADDYVVDYPYGKEWAKLRKPRFTFLQHGVTKDDLSSWLNAKDIDCFVTASPFEHASIVESRNPYKFTEREVVLSGFPRHDALGTGAQAPDRIVVIMPTWRHSLTGAKKDFGNEREHNPAFYDSEYALRWRSLLHAPALRALTEEHGYRVQFFPHANVQPYLSWFAPPPYIETMSHRPDRSMQEVFRSAAVMLTDYSSTVFEMAYLRKAVLYYQFDRELVFGGGHLTKKGYFDYDRDGFGPVCADEAAVLEALSAILAAEGTPAPEYLARMERTFAFRDGRACERTLDAILALDAPTHPRDRSAELLVEAARSATALRAWEAAERRWARVLEQAPTARPDDAECRLLEAKRELGKYDEVDALLVAMEARGVPALEVDLERAELATAAQHWQRAAVLWAERASSGLPEAERIRASVRLAEAHRRSGALEPAARALDGIQLDVEPLAMLVERAELASARARWGESAQRWAALARDPGMSSYAQLRLAEALARAGDDDRALEAIDVCLAGGATRYESRARALRLALTIAMREREPAKLDETDERRSAE